MVIVALVLLLLFIAVVIVDVPAVRFRLEMSVTANMMIVKRNHAILQYAKYVRTVLTHAINRGGVQTQGVWGRAAPASPLVFMPWKLDPTYTLNKPSRGHTGHKYHFPSPPVPEFICMRCLIFVLKRYVGQHQVPQITSSKFGRSSGA